MKYEIEIHDYYSRMAMRQFVLENFIVEEIRYRHSSDGETTIAAMTLRLKPKKCKNEYIRDPDGIT